MGETDRTDERALALLIYNATGFTGATVDLAARKILASDWLAEDRARIRREFADEAIEAIEAAKPTVWSFLQERGLGHAARIVGDLRDGGDDRG